MRDRLQDNRDPTHSGEIILELLKISLERNDFMFDDSSLKLR